MEDEEKAAELLKEFDEKTKILGRLIMNVDQNLSNEEWKKKCDEAKKEVDKIIQKIKQLD